MAIPRNWQTTQNSTGADLYWRPQIRDARIDRKRDLKDLRVKMLRNLRKRS